MSEFKIFPQMQSYKDMPSGEFPPYSMLAGPYNYRSKIINTDSYGFRRYKYKNKEISVETINNFEEVSLIIGGSTVFGVGSSGDDTTISAYLTSKTEMPWINFGIRGGVSIQEYIHLINHISKAKQIKNIVFFSGINDIYRNFIDSEIAKYDKRFQYQNDEYSFFSARRIALAYVKSIIFFKPIKSFLNSSHKTSIKKYAENLEANGMEILKEIYDRNFMLYKGLEQVTGANTKFFLQPFLHWTGKNLSYDETKSLEYLEELQKDTSWPDVKKRLCSDAVMNGSSKIIKDSAEFNKINFVNTNSLYKKNDSLFVDSVHLNDSGAELAASIIYDSLIK